MTAPLAGCGHCGAALQGDGPSPDYCGETCQRLWQRRLGDALPVLVSGGVQAHIQEAQ